MKKSILTLCFIFGLTSTAFATPWFGGSIQSVTITKANQSISVSGAFRYIQKTATSACQFFINAATGTGYPIVAATEYEREFPKSVTSVVFNCTSSAGNIIHYTK